MLIEMPIYHWIMLLQCSWTFSFACKRVSFFKLKKGKEEGGRNAIVRWPNLKGQSRPSADSVALRQLPKADPHRCARRVSTRGFSFCGGPLRWTPSPAPPTSCPPPCPLESGDFWLLWRKENRSTALRFFFGRVGLFLKKWWLAPVPEIQCVLVNCPSMINPTSPQALRIGY